MLPGPRERVERPVWLEPSVVLTSPAAGTWHPAVAPDARVRAGDLLGTLTDYFGEPAAEVRAPIRGVVLYVVASPAMSEGEPVAMVARAAERV
jgi:predicted deacylase